MADYAPLPIRRAISPAAADADGLATTQTPLDAGNLTLASTSLDIPRHVTITSADDDSGRTFTVTGTSRTGETITEAITGPSTTTVSGAKNFSTVTQIAVDAATAGAITAGWGDSFETGWIPRDRQSESATLSVALIDTPSLSVDVEHTWDDVYAVGFDESAAAKVDDASLVSKTASFYGAVPYAIAHRLAVTSFVSGDITLTLMQAP